jgi:hypothetical protein
MRCLKQDRSAGVVIAGHALVQSIRRGHYELAVEEPTNRRLAVAFDELILAIWSRVDEATSVCPGPAQRNSARQDRSGGDSSGPPGEPGPNLSPVAHASGL